MIYVRTRTCSYRELPVRPSNNHQEKCRWLGVPTCLHTHTHTHTHTRTYVCEKLHVDLRVTVPACVFDNACQPLTCDVAIDAHPTRAPKAALLAPCHCACAWRFYYELVHVQSVHRSFH